MHQRDYPVNILFVPFLALIIQRIFSIPTDSLMLTFLKYSRHLREYCVFKKFQMLLNSPALNRLFHPTLKTFFPVGRPNRTYLSDNWLFQGRQMISHLSTIMRYSLSVPQKNVKIQDETNHLKMLIQPLVENEIYHVINENSKKA